MGQVLSITISSLFSLAYLLILCQGFSCPVAPTHSTKVSKNGETNANLIAAGIQLLKATAQIGEQFSEDCLTLNVVNDNIEAFGGDPSQITIYSVIQLVVHL